jgi:hypothetical protein
LENENFPRLANSQLSKLKKNKLPNQESAFESFLARCVAQKKNHFSGTRSGIEFRGKLPAESAAAPTAYFSFNLTEGEILSGDMKVAAGSRNDGRSPPRLPSLASDFEYKINQLCNKMP